MPGAHDWILTGSCGEAALGWPAGPWRGGRMENQGRARMADLPSSWAARGCGV